MQQYPFGNANDKYKKKLFVDTGFEYKEVNARIIEPYLPPAPQVRTKELEVVNAPSHFHTKGISSYKCTMNLLFPDKQSFRDYLMWCGWTHKFYDEKGHIFIGAVESMKQTIHEANRRYKVEIALILVKKDEYKKQHRYQFQDLVDTDGSTHWAKADIEELSDLGMVTVIDREGYPVLYFRPEDFVTRAEFVVFLNRTRKFIEGVIRE